MCEEVIKDIEEHLYQWSCWSYYIDKEEERLKDEKIIKEKIAKLRKVLEDYDNRHKRVMV